MAESSSRDGSDNLLGFGVLGLVAVGGGAAVALTGDNQREITGGLVAGGVGVLVAVLSFGGYALYRRQQEAVGVTVARSKGRAIAATLLLNLSAPVAGLCISDGLQYLLGLAAGPLGWRGASAVCAAMTAGGLLLWPGKKREVAASLVPTTVAWAGGFLALAQLSGAAGTATAGPASLALSLGVVMCAGAVYSLKRRKSG